MGQRTSRLSPPAPAPPTNIPVSQPNDSRSDGDAMSGSDRHARSSLDPQMSADASDSSKRSKRKSILGSITGKSRSLSGSVRNRIDTLTSNITDRGSRPSAGRRGLRISKRWSKAPTETHEGSVGSLNEFGQRDVEGASGSVLTGKGAERASEPPAVEPTPSSEPGAHSHIDDSAAHHDEPSMARIASPQQAELAQLEADSGSDAQSEQSTDEEDFHPFSIDEPPQPPVETPLTGPQLVPSGEGLMRGPGRHFPPAGTLVVVQGVVHTSDVAAANQSNQPPAPHARRSSSVPALGRNVGRNRLSSLISRPIRSRPTSYISPDTQSHSEASERGHSESDSPQNESSATSEDVHAASSPMGDNPSARTSAEPQAPPRPAPLSSTSIDVLGTLLSVATAATAASLVTGSSDPLFSSGLALPGATNLQPSNSTAPESDLAANRPTSPTPTAGLGSFGSMGAQPPSGRERMRGAWDSLRDRIGLLTGRNIPGSGSANSPADSAADPRAQLLAEVARAFNLGMRLDHNNADGSNADQEAGSQSSSTDDLPPEDSFERFLMDLQVDLRRTLSEDVVQQEAEVPSQTASDPATAPQPTADEGSSDLLPWPTTYNNLAEENRVQPEHAAGPTGEGNQRPDADDVEVDDPTAREDLSDSGSDDEDRASASSADHEPQSGAPSAAPQPLPQVPHSRTASGSERRPGGGINWWRLYRFPPQHAPNAQGHGLLPPSSAALDSDGVPSGMPTPSGADTPTSASGDAPSAGENMIVPVILVGLQSVIGRNAPEQNAYLHSDAPDGDSAGDDGGVDSEYGDDERSVGGAPRGRPWRSRAADAFRGLRPGRRGEAANEPQASETGSTTFFIYVIGGYYPPNHHLVTGNDPLDSFEALWELAEMLGQVKPPTATREDIAKSGLEVIRPSDLEQYEKDGRVASNCVERCLICLEEYAPEEDLRLMTCRHLFHKTCVDRWLQTGRNNCPACRSQGVSTGPGAAETPTTG